MSIFLAITFTAMVAVFSVDALQKRREFVKQHQSSKKNDFQYMFSSFDSLYQRQNPSRDRRIFLYLSQQDLPNCVRKPPKP